MEDDHAIARFCRVGGVDRDDGGVFHPGADDTAGTDAAAPVVTPPPPPPAATARHRVTFQSTGSRDTHPEDWPADAHYSGLIGGTHNALVAFWQDGLLATPGIQAMAEQGRKSPLDQEVLEAIAAGTAQHVLSGDALSDSPGTVTLDFEIGVDCPRVTPVTMVAPSPDWFVGVNGMSLLEDGQWAAEPRVVLFLYDAGHRLWRHGGGVQHVLHVRDSSDSPAVITSAPLGGIAWFL